MDAAGQNESGAQTDETAASGSGNAAFGFAFLRVGLAVKIKGSFSVLTGITSGLAMVAV